MLIRGGPIAWALLALSVLALTVIIAKGLSLRGTLSGRGLRERALALWPQDRAGAVALLAQGHSPADRLLAQAMRGVSEGRGWPALERDLEWRGNAEITGLSRHIRLLELIAMISPLTGLLGTVVGMIQSFQNLALAEGAANAALLADGIWVALLTTAAGLLVAIPAAVAASLYAARIEEVAQSMEAAVGDFQTRNEAAMAA